jgi:hypothetical protein
MKFSKNMTMDFAIIFVLLVSSQAASQEQDWLSYYRGLAATR